MTQQTAIQQAATRVKDDGRMERRWRDFQPLLEHFNAGQVQAEKSETATKTSNRKLKASQARRRKRAHRPLSLSWTAGLVGLLLLCQLVMLLWLHGSALSAARRDAQLKLQIAQARDDVARTQEKIAALNSAGRIERLAKEHGWRLPKQDEFDDVTNVPHNVSNVSNVSPPDGGEGSAQVEVVVLRANENIQR